MIVSWEIVKLANYYNKGYDTNLYEDSTVDIICINLLKIKFIPVIFIQENAASISINRTRYSNKGILFTDTSVLILEIKSEVTGWCFFWTILEDWKIFR